MPRRVRDLLNDLIRAGFLDRGGKGSHSNLKHPSGVRITISGSLDGDAKPDQERDVARALKEAQS